jgi:predicted O-linked N-acetylglucosamine transferase (SPINDLY family)
MISVVFGCFNNPTKFSDALYRAWAEILRQVPGSRLLLKGRDVEEPQEKALLTGRMRAAGLPVERVEWISRTRGTREHLGQYGLIDIALDTFPYNGTTTTCEALWMGRPVVTVAGARHAARVGASLLTATGHPELIAATTEDYVRTAVGLASDRTALAALSAGLRSDMQCSALCDLPGQSARFAAALRACWAARCGAAAHVSSAQPEEPLVQTR